MNPVLEIQVSTVGEEMLYNPRLTKDEVIYMPAISFINGHLYKLKLLEVILISGVHQIWINFNKLNIFLDIS